MSILYLFNSFSPCKNIDVWVLGDITLCYWYTWPTANSVWYGVAIFKLHNTSYVGVIVWCNPPINIPWLWHLCFCVVWSPYEYTLVVAFVFLCGVIPLWIHLGCGICVIVWCDPPMNTPWLWHLCFLCGVIPLWINFVGGIGVIAFWLWQFFWKHI